MYKMPTVNILCVRSKTSDVGIYEDRQGSIVVSDSKNEWKFTSRRQCLSFLKQSGLTVSEYALNSIREDLRDLGDKKGLVYEE